MAGLGTHGNSRTLAVLLGEERLGGAALGLAASGVPAYVDIC